MTDHPPIADEHSAAQALAEDVSMAQRNAADLLRLLSRPLARQQINALPARHLARLVCDAGLALRLVERIRVEILAALGLPTHLDADLDPFAGTSPAATPENGE